MNEDEIKKRTEEEVSAYLEKRKKPAMICYGLIFVALFALWIYTDIKFPYSKSSSKPSPSYSSTSSGSSPPSSSHTSLVSNNPNEYAPGVTVVATPVQIGDKLVIRTRVSNHNSYAINKKIRLFAEDVRGVKHIVDIIHADMEPMQVGNSTSSIPLSKIGVPPHRIVVE